MATTIYGCDNPATGQVDFDVCDTADYSACFEVMGDHAGQVKLIISGTNCDDTYYGCYNNVTGKYEVIVPDDCCEVGCPSGVLTLTFSNVVECNPCKEHGEGEYCWPRDLNRAFELTGGEFGGGNYLCWHVPGNWCWSANDYWCVGLCCLPSTGLLGIYAAYCGWDVGIGGVAFWAHNIAGDAGFADNELTLSDCLEDKGDVIPINNGLDDGTCEGESGPGSWIAGYDGEVSISFD